MDPFAPMPLAELTLDNIRQIVDDEVAEDLYLDYKAELDLGAQDAKKEFLRDVTAFANSQGGVLVCGIEAHGGVPRKMLGFAVPDTDAFVQTVESLLRDGIDERLPRYEIQLLKLSGDKHILLIRVPASLRAPHMVTLAGERRFYTRNNAGKHPMSTAEVRDAVSRSQSIEEGIRAFVEKRLETIRPVAQGRALWALHIVPLLRSAHLIDVTEPATTHLLVQAGEGFGRYPEHCLDGYKIGTRDADGLLRYALFFRDGSIEFVDQHLLYAEKEPRTFPYEGFDRDLMGALSHAFSLYRDGPLTLPTAVCITLDNVRGYQLPTSHGIVSPKLPHGRIPCDPIVLTELPAQPEDAIRPALDLIWNAFGQERCCGYDRTGKYVGYRNV